MLRSLTKGSKDGSRPEAAAGVERADAAAVNSAMNRPLYKAREPIYPKLVHGRFRTIKWAMLIIALTVYYLLPWVRWPRAGDAPDQAVLVDFAGRRFYFFFIEIWPQELYYVTGLLILSALGLFLVTSLLGRVWCGYACPQTVWTDLFILVERLIEGDRSARIRLDKSAWTSEKLAKKAAKHAVWLLIAMMTGGAWIFYFHDAPSVLPALFTGDAPSSSYVFIAVLTFTTYFLAGYMREQVCTYMCPWPRIQAALTDEYALNVTYRTDRGEPRGFHKKGEPWEGRGDCIDCNQCVAACPMGIDIRDGAQLECIHCALCIDACDEVMTKVGRPTGLIAYDTDRAIAARKAGQPVRIRLIRPRTILYAVVLVFVASLMIYSLATRSTIDLNVLRDRNPSFVRLSDGSVRNAFTVKVVNRANEERRFLVEAQGEGEFAVRIVGVEEGAHQEVAVRGGQVRQLRMFLTVPADTVKGAPIPVTILVRDAVTGETRRNPTSILTGEAR